MASNRWTPILFAVRYGYLEIVKLLVENGAALDQRNPIHVCQYSNYCHYSVLKYLLQKEVSPNSDNLLANVVQLKNRDLIGLFLLYGAVYEQDY